MTGTEVQLWLNIIVMVLAISNMAYTWLSVRHKVNKAAIEQLTDEVILLGNRISVLEHQARSFPTHTDIGRVYERINNVGGKLEKVIGTLEAMTNQLSLVNEHLMSGGKR